MCCCILTSGARIAYVKLVQLPFHFEKKVWRGGGLIYNLNYNLKRRCLSQVKRSVVVSRFISYTLEMSKVSTVRCCVALF